MLPVISGGVRWMVALMLPALARTSGATLSSRARVRYRRSAA